MIKEKRNIILSPFALKWLSSRLAGISQWSARNPRRVFLLMVSLLACSAILCFTLFRTEPKMAGTRQQGLKEKAGAGILGLSQSAGNLMQVLQMQAELNGLLSTKQLNSGDSLKIAAMLQRIRQLQNNITNHEKNQP